MGSKSTIKFEWLLNLIDNNYKKLSCILLALPTKSKHQTNENEQQLDDFNNEYTQTTSDFVHSKRIVIFYLIK